MTEREAPPDWGFDSRQDDSYEDDGWFGGAQVAEPASVQVAEPAPAQEAPHRSPAQPAGDGWEEPSQPPSPAAPAPAPPPRRPISPTVSTWTVNGQLRASNNSALTFRSPPPPWYRTKPARIALVAVACAAVAVPVVLLAFRSNPAAGPMERTSVAPRPSMSAQPAPSSAPSTPINAPPPLPPPPPPPPTEDAGAAPSYNQPDWTRSAPPPEEKPDIGVTRTPATRAPISVAPQPRTPASGAETGDGRKGWHCAGWC